MTTTHTTRRFGAAGCLAASLSLVALAGCSSEDARTTPGTPTQSLQVTTSAAPAFEEKDVPVKKAEVLTEPVKDEGLNVTWELQGTVGGNAGGSVLTLLVTNNNEAPLPPEAIGDPVLKLSDGTVVERLDAEAAGVAGQDGLDLPLGAGASTNLRYPFNVAPGNLWNASLEIGNVLFEGNLNR